MPRLEGLLRRRRKMKKKTKTKKIKKKELLRNLEPKNVTSAIVNIFASFNNTILTLTDRDGNSLGWASAGTLGFKGTKKPTPYVAASVASKIIEKAKEYGVLEVEIRAKGVGPGRDSAMRAFTNSQIVVNTIKDITPVPHGGVRPKKPRKV